MKNLERFIAICALLTTVIFQTSKAQNAFSESFENIPIKFTSSTTNGSTASWDVSTRFQTDGLKSDTARVVVNDTLILTSDTFSTAGKTFVTLEFDHICDIFSADSGFVDVTRDGGVNWHTISKREYFEGPPVKDGGPIFLNKHAFNETMYPAIWGGLNLVPIIDNTWWKREIFNISKYLGFPAGGADSSSAFCQIRFRLASGGGAVSINTNGWFIDSVLVTADICETIKPLGNFIPPLIPNNSIQFSLGPYKVSSKFKDKHSGMDTAFVYYTVNNTGIWDTIGMSLIPATLGDSMWEGFIPSTYNGGLSTIAVGDSICYYVKGFDKSVPCANFSRLPGPLSSDTCFKFYVSAGETIPFCDNFDATNFWSTVSVPNTDSIWEKGSPLNYPPFSGGSSWITKELLNYQDNVIGYLYSPIFDFGTARSARISFMQRRDMMNQDGDYLTLEYSVNQGPYVTLGVDDDPAGVILNEPNCPSTWYTSSFVGATANSWNGDTDGWVQSFYQLPSSFDNIGDVRFRFKFQSDGGGNDYGISIDDFCIENPDSVDASVVDILTPGDYQDNADTNFVKVEGASQFVTIVVRNLGTESITSLPINYTMNYIAGGGGSVVVNETYNFLTSSTKFPLGLPSLEIDTLTFTTPFNVPGGHFTVTAYPSLANDGDLTNDSITSNGHFGFASFVLPVKGSYQNNFDDVDPRWATTSAIVQCGNSTSTESMWERGIPNWGATNSSYSAPNVWDVNLDGPYGINASRTGNREEYLYTEFFDLTNANQAFVSLWYNMNTPASTDGFRIQYRWSSDTARWTMLTQFPYNPVPTEVNWFGGNGIADGLWGWSGNSNGWVYAQYPLSAVFNTVTATQVQFRFVFVSDGDGSNPGEDGVSIDNFRIVNPPPYDVELVDFILPEDGCVKEEDEPVQVIVRNVGLTAIDSVPICFSYNHTSGTPGSTNVCDTIFDMIPVGDTVIFTFDSLIDMTSFGIYEFDAWTQHSLDSTYTNDSLLGYTAENIRGCKVGVTITTGGTIPVGSSWLIVDTLTNDTIIEVPFSVIGANNILWNMEVCMPEIGDYKFILTPNAADFVSYAELKDLYADTAVLLLNGPTGPNGSGFHWECPPLLSAAPVGIHPEGKLKSLPIPQTYDIIGEVRNRGSLKLRSVELTLKIEEEFPVPLGFTLTQVDTVQLLPPLSVLQKGSYNFSNVWNASPGRYLITLITRIPNGSPDLATFDDTTTLVYTIVDSVLNLNTPYCNDFDDNPLMNPWGSFSKTVFDTLSTFERGTPNQTINAANSAPNAWMTGLSSDYVGLDTSTCVSPLFKVNDTSSCYRISFSHWFKTEYSFDGGVVEYSVDSGDTWFVLGAIGDTIYADSGSIQNWYNTPYVVGLTGSPQPSGWTGNSNGYINSFYDIKFPDFGKDEFNVVFRFRFGADASFNDDGWAIDDFCFEKGGVCKYTSCTDGIQNQGETGIDCGGPCDSCVSCFDGIQNQNETGIDCGGVCVPCPSCVDGIQNGNETSIDCGGPDCAPCGTCNDGIRNFQWRQDQSGKWFKLWEGDFQDCGGPCPPCWVGIDELREDQFGLSQNIPNPTDGRTVIHYAVPSNGTVNISIRNLMGQQMYSTSVNAKQGINQLEVDVTDWSSGVYYYTFEFEEQQLIRKMTVYK